MFFLHLTQRERGRFPRVPERGQVSSRSRPVQVDVQHRPKANELDGCGLEPGQMEGAPRQGHRGHQTRLISRPGARPPAVPALACHAGVPVLFWLHFWSLSSFLSFFSFIFFENCKWKMACVSVELLSRALYIASHLTMQGNNQLIGSR